MPVKCARCLTTRDTREELQEHAAYLHGDFISTRTRKEYLKFCQDRWASGDSAPDETWSNAMTLARGIPVQNFMSEAKLKQLIRAGQAVSDLYSVRVRKKGKKSPEIGGRKPKKTCAKCGDSFQATHGNQTRCKDCRTPSKRVKKLKKPKKARKKGRRRRRCAREKCDRLFLPKTKRSKYCRDSCRTLVYREGKT